MSKRSVDKCPHCNGPLYWQEYSGKPGTTFKVRCHNAVYLSYAYQPIELMCTFSCEGIRGNSGDITIECDEEDYLAEKYSEKQIEFDLSGEKNKKNV